VYPGVVVAVVLLILIFRKLNPQFHSRKQPRHPLRTAASSPLASFALVSLHVPVFAFPPSPSARISP
jgi:hypothetical protein